MFDLHKINFADELLGIVIAILQAVLIAIITKILLDRAFKDQRLIGKNLQQYGIKKVRADSGGTLSKSSRDIVFGLNGKLYPNKLDLCFITGHGFFRDFQTKAKYLETLLQNGCQIRVLLANPYTGTFKDTTLEDYANPKTLDALTEYYYNILTNETQSTSFLERAYVMLIKTKVLCDNSDKIDKEKLRKHLKVQFLDNNTMDGEGDHNYQVKNIQKICHELKKSAKNGGCIELRFYEDEYQMPIILAQSYIDIKQKERNEESILLWTNINAPIKETSESINVFCSSDIDDIKNKTFINDVKSTFDYLWQLYEKKI